MTNSVETMTEENCFGDLPEIIFNKMFEKEGVSKITDISYEDVTTEVVNRGLLISVWKHGYTERTKHLKPLLDWKKNNKAIHHKQVNIMDIISFNYPIVGEMTEERYDESLPLSAIAKTMMGLIDHIWSHHKEYFSRFNKIYQKRFKKYQTKPITEAGRYLLLQHLPEDMVKEIMSYEEQPAILDQLSKPKGISYYQIVNISNTDWCELIAWIEEKSVSGNALIDENLDKYLESYSYFTARLKVCQESVERETGIADTPKYDRCVFQEEVKAECDWQTTHSFSLRECEYPYQHLPIYHKTRHTRLGFPDSHYPPIPDFEILLIVNQLSGYILRLMTIKARINYQSKLGLTGMIRFNKHIHKKEPSKADFKKKHSKKAFHLVKKYEFLYPHEMTRWKENRYAYYCDPQSRPFWYNLWNIIDEETPKLAATFNPPQETPRTRSPSIIKAIAKCRKMKEEEIIRKIAPLLARFEFPRYCSNLCQHQLGHLIIRHATSSVVADNIFETIKGIAELVGKNGRGADTKCWKHIAQVLKIQGRSKLMTLAQRVPLLNLIKKDIDLTFKYY